MAINKTILVTGANGQLGSCLRELANANNMRASLGANYKFVFTDVAELDITSSQAVATMFKEAQPDWVINCAAYTAVDKAESDIELARLLNATAVGILAEEANKVGAGIVHISTDYVFKGDDPQPRVETDATEPQSVYGVTKLEGEKLVAAKNSKHIIIRTSWLYSIYDNNFVKTMRLLGSEKTEIGVVCDQWGSPTSAHDLANAILTAIRKPVYGVYHFSNEGATNWALFAEEIMKLSTLECRVNHITTEQYPTPAKRPQYSLMSKEEFSKTYEVVISEWEISLENVIHKLNKN